MQGACRLEEPSEQSPSSGGYLFFYCTFFLWVGVQATLWDAHLQSYWNCQHFRAFEPFPPLQYWFGTDYIEREGTICKSNLHLKGPFFKALIADPEKMSQMLYFFQPSLGIQKRGCRLRHLNFWKKNLKIDPLQIQWTQNLITSASSPCILGASEIKKNPRLLRPSDQGKQIISWEGMSYVITGAGGAVARGRSNQYPQGGARRSKGPESRGP